MNDMLIDAAGTAIKETGHTRRMLSKSGRAAKMAENAHMQLLKVLDQPAKLIRCIALWRLSETRDAAGLLSQHERQLTRLLSRINSVRNEPEPLPQWIFAAEPALGNRTRAEILVKEVDGAQKLTSVITAPAKKAVVKINAKYSEMPPRSGADDLYAQLIDWPRARYPNQLELPSEGCLVIRKRVDLPLVHVFWTKQFNRLAGWQLSPDRSRPLEIDLETLRTLEPA